LERDGIRLVSVTGEWSCPVHGAGGQRWQLDPLAAQAGQVSPFDEPRSSRPMHRPPGAVPSGSPAMDPPRDWSGTPEPHAAAG
jgi:DNA polymerase-3 subunit epsilon